MGQFLQNPDMPGKAFYQADDGAVTEAQIVKEDATGRMFMQSETGELKELLAGGPQPPLGADPAVPWGHVPPGGVQPPPAAPPSPPRPVGEQALRAAEFGARGVVDSAAEWAGVVPDLVAQGMDKVGIPGMPPPGYYGNKLKQGFNAATEHIPNPLDMYDGANVGEPSNALERAAYGGGRGLVDAGSMLVPGAAIVRGAKQGSTLQSVGKTLMAQPGMQAVAGTVGGAVEGGTENPYLGMAASVAAPGAGSAKRYIERLASKRGTDRATQKMVKIATEVGDGDMALGITRMKQRIAAGGDDTAILDVGGDTAQRTTRAISAVGGKGSEIVDDFIVGRMSGRGRRLHKAANNLARDKYHKMLNTLDRLKRKEASPLYDEAFRPRAWGHNQWDEGLDTLLNLKEVRKGMGVGINTQRLEAAAEGRPFNFKDYSVKGLDDKGDIILEGKPNMRAMDAAKRGLDAQIYHPNNLNPITGEVMWTAELNALDNVRAAIVRKLDAMTTDSTGRSAYKEARAAWSGPTHFQEVATRGRRFLLGDEEVTTAAIKAMTHSEKQAFRIGARRQLTTMINTDTQSALTKFAAKKDDLWRKMRATFPDDGSFDDFRAAIRTELEKARTEKYVNMRAQSQTASVQTDIKELSNVPNAAAEAADKISKGGNWMGALFDYTMRKPKNWAMAPNAKTATRLATLLTEMDPAAQQKIFDGMSKSGFLTPAQQKGGKLTTALLAKLIAAQQGGQELERSYGPGGMP